ncbi:MAG TPA: glycosyltransferase family 2 protein, partial [Candidatus Acidoferrum sp.]|nr:glycosyltransferase family 2 protein [Candidatus Acidoferrum sp.]
ALGSKRVLTLPRPRGFAAAVTAAAGLPVAAGADYLLVIHDDAELDPDAVARLVEAAVGVPGVEDAGVVGAKVVDHEDPRLLRDVGRSADRFGHGYTALQPGEIDQGQFDRMIEVLCVSSCAMLISRAAWRRVGGFDERFDTAHGELDLCWRMRVAGFRVVMTPLARVRHRGASTEDDRTERPRHSPRYEEDRAATATMLKNYGVLSLAWLLPLSLVLAMVRLAYLTLGRRFEEGYDVVAAIGWNLAHLPDTLRRRRAVQRARRAGDRRLRPFTESAGLRIPRWFQTAERIWEEQHEIDLEGDAEHVARRLRDRTASLVATHPVLVASFLGVIVGGTAIRGLLGTGALAGGVLPSFPASPAGFWAELGSAYRTTGLGGTLAASPALGGLGALSSVLFASTSLAQKVILGGGPALAAVVMYRAAMRLTRRPGPAVIAAVAYGLSAIVLWAFSEGRLDLLVCLAVLPAATERLDVAFGPDAPPGGGWRFIAGLGVTIAIGVAFLPGIVLPIAVVVLVNLVAGRSRVDGLSLLGRALAAAAVLLFPFVPTLISGGGAGLGSRVGTTSVTSLARLALGPGPGTWAIAWFLPVGAILAFALVGKQHGRRATKTLFAAVAALTLAWLSSAGYLPAAASNAPAYAALAAVAEAMLVAFGLASVLTGLGRESFGLRQIGTALLTLVLGAGILLQATAAMVGGWNVAGPQRIPAAWAVVSSAEAGDFSVLWIGVPDGRPFPPPGGDPTGVAAAGPASLRFSLTGRDGETALDTGRTLTGPGADALHEAVEQIVSGRSAHGGALLAPFGVRFLVADPGDLTAAARAPLDEQIDLDRVPAAGLVIYRNTSAIPPASVVPADPGTLDPIGSADPAEASMFRPGRATALSRVPGGWSGASGPGEIVLATEYDGAWRLEGSAAQPRRAFGWATAFPTAGGHVRVRYGSQLPRSIALWLLAGLWVAALWITRKPVAR